MKLGSARAAAVVISAANVPACESEVSFAYEASEIAACSCAFSTTAWLKLYSLIQGPKLVSRTSRPGTAWYAERAAASSRAESAVSTFAARANDCAATTCANPLVHGARPPP